MSGTELLLWAWRHLMFALYYLSSHVGTSLDKLLVYDISTSAPFSHLIKLSAKYGHLLFLAICDFSVRVLVLLVAWSTLESLEL